MKTGIRRLRYKLLIALTMVFCLVFIATAFFYNRAVENSILTEQQRTLHRLTDLVVMSLEAAMLERHPEMMPGYVKGLSKAMGVIDLQIARIDGTEAFRDNRTRNAVNHRLGEILFPPQSREPQTTPVFLPDDPQIKQLLEGSDTAVRIDAPSDRGKQTLFFDTIPCSAPCQKCHGSEQQILGVVKVTSSLAEVERDLSSARLQSLIVLVVVVTLTIGATGYILGHTIAGPIEAVSDSMQKISAGHWNSEIKVASNDELGEMADSFNIMSRFLGETYENMRLESERIKTLLQGAQEVLVVTDASGAVVLVNGAACELLGKSEAQIRAEGIVNLVDQPQQFQAMMDATDGRPAPSLFNHRDRWLFGSVSTIRDGGGNSIGSAALLRDVTQEQRLLRELHRLSTTDALTDVFNRRHLDSKLKTEMDRAIQSGLPLSVIMLDADHFKKFNDTYGHDQGDRVLIAIGRAMKSVMRDYDLPCRYGGEEFAVLLPNADAEQALGVAERLRLEVEQMRVDGLQVTISLGVACYPDIAAETPEALISAADAALYLSKAGGRNRATVAVPKGEGVG